MMLTKQTQKLIFMFVVYSIIGYFIDNMFAKTWMHTQTGVLPTFIPQVAYTAPMWGIAAIVLYYVLKMKNFGPLPKILMASVTMILIGCLTTYGQAMMYDPVMTIGNCITGEKVVMWVILVVMFQYINKPLVRSVFGKKGSA